MDETFVSICLHLTSAVAAGGMIGLERSYHGRAAGFRTHVLVCLASSLLMLLMMYQDEWLHGLPLETLRTDPTRMAQGIMTGIGFLGAGVIFKNGLAVRGLTTAASIWMTAAIGILLGVGFYVPALIATLLTLATLSIFRWIEERFPSHFYAHHFVRFDRAAVMPEDRLRQFLGSLGFQVADMSHRLSDDGAFFEYRMVLRTRTTPRLAELAVAWREREDVRSFGISPRGD